MVTDYGAIKTTADYNRKMYNQYNSAGVLCCIILSCFGVTGLTLLLCFVLPIPDFRFFAVLYIVVFVILTISGLALLTAVLFSINKNVKRQRYNIAEIYSQYMIISVYEKGVRLQQLKVDYKDIVKRIECKDFFFVVVKFNSMVPIGKKGLSSAELNSVRSIFKLPLKQSDARIVPENSLHAETEYEVIKSPKNIFEDFSDDKGGNV